MSYFHPDRMPVLPARRREAARRQLEELVERTGRQPRRRPKPVAVSIVAAGLVLSTGAASYVLASYQPVTQATIRCYPKADAADPTFVTISTPGLRAGVKPAIPDALAVCRGFFRRGTITVGTNTFRYRSAGRYPVPELVVCTMADGSAAVFPGEPGTCARLGLPAASRSHAGARTTRKPARRP